MTNGEVTGTIGSRQVVIEGCTKLISGTLDTSHAERFRSKSEAQNMYSVVHICQ
jgi:hypothetical protein